MLVLVLYRDRYTPTPGRLKVSNTKIMCYGNKRIVRKIICYLVFACFEMACFCKLQTKENVTFRTNLSHRKSQNTHTGNSRCPGAHRRPGSDMEGYKRVFGSNTPCIQRDRHTGSACSTALHSDIVLCILLKRWNCYGRYFALFISWFACLLNCVVFISLIMDFSAWLYLVIY